MIQANENKITKQGCLHESGDANHAAQTASKRISPTVLREFR